MADATALINALDGMEDRVLRIAASTMFAVHKQRIFGQGRASDETEIGEYSTKPAYFNPKDFPKKFSPLGKHGAKDRKTRYFPDGYKGARQASGRQTERVDLRLTGTMEQSFQQDREGKAVIFGFLFEDQGKKAEGNEEHFGKKIFDVSKKELEILPRVFAEENI